MYSLSMFHCTECSEITGSGQDTAYIHPPGYHEPFQVICNFGVGVTYIQMRNTDNVNFNRSWSEYEAGFGDVAGGDYWLGFNKIRPILSIRSHKIGFRYFSSSVSWQSSTYTDVSIDDQNDNYRLRYSSHIGGTDVISPSDGTKNVRDQIFSAHDRDPTGCASKNGGGWWFNTGCSESNLNAEIPFTIGTRSDIKQTKLGVY